MVQFLDELPPIRSTERGKRPLSPELVEFLDALKQNPGKWAQYPIERKTKPDLPSGFKTARRDGVLYAKYEAPATEAGEDVNEAPAEDTAEAESVEFETAGV